MKSKEHDKGINVVGVIIITAMYIYVYALGTIPLYLGLIIILNIIFSFYLIKTNLKDWKKLISFYLFVVIGTMLYINENGVDFIISQWESHEYYLDNKLNISVLITFVSICGASVWSSIFALFLDKNVSSSSDTSRLKS